MQNLSNMEGALQKGRIRPHSHSSWNALPCYLHLLIASPSSKTQVQFLLTTPVFLISSTICISPHNEPPKCSSTCKLYSLLI